MTDLISRQDVLDAIVKWRLESGPISTAIYDVVKDMPADQRNNASALLDEIEAKDAALKKISAIRDSIVGMQGFNFSEHAYPLVAVLDAAGYEGAGYEISRKNLGTLIEQIEAADARIAELEAALEAQERLYQTGLLFTDADEIERVHAMRRAALPQSPSKGDAS